MNEVEWRAISQSVRLSEFDLCIQRRDTGYGRDQQGFTGTATLRVDRNAPSEARAQFTALAGFADYSGTGAQTTHGFGATSATILPGSATSPSGEKTTLATAAQPLPLPSTGSAEVLSPAPGSARA